MKPSWSVFMYGLIAVATFVLADIVYTANYRNNQPVTQPGPQGHVGAKGDSGTTFRPDLYSNLNACSDLVLFASSQPNASPNYPVSFLIAQDNRCAVCSTPDNSCATIRNNLGNDTTTDDLSGHLLIWDGTQWSDFGPFQGTPGAQGPQGQPFQVDTFGPIGDGFFDQPPSINALSSATISSKRKTIVRNIQTANNDDTLVTTSAASLLSMIVLQDERTSFVAPFPYDLSHHLLVWDGNQWTDFGTFNSIPGPQGPPGRNGDPFQVDQFSNLTSCADITQAELQFPDSTSPSAYIWLVEVDSRPNVSGCPVIYGLDNTNHTGNDLSGHLLVFNGSIWRDWGSFSAIQGPAGPQGPPGPAGPIGPSGNTILYGTVPPTILDGVDGNFYVDTNLMYWYGPKSAGIWPSPTPLKGNDGNTLLSGTVAPSALDGLDGDFYIDTITTVLYGPKASGTWPAGVTLIGSTGTPGTNGTNGKTILSGNTNPTALDGTNGDFYINLVSKELFGPKALGSWPSGISLVGTPGNNGTNGTNGNTILSSAINPTALDGVDGDYFLNTATVTLFGPKSSGAWPSGVVLVGATGAPGANGNTLLSGAVNPTALDGADGDFYINTALSTLFGPKASGSWPSGVSLIGPTGMDGNSVRYGVGAPSNGLGVNGDFYINTSSYFIYGPKSGGVWPSGTSLVGPQGAAGFSVLSGSGTPSNGTGVNGDWYINTVTYDLYGPKSGGTWSLATSLVGPMGPQGTGWETLNVEYDGRSIAFVSSLGATVGNFVGEFMLTLDTGDVYDWNGSSWNVVATTTPFYYFDNSPGLFWYVSAPMTSAVSYDAPSGSLVLDTVTSDVYVRTLTVWQFATNIKGNQGNPGTNGTNGTNGYSVLNGFGAPSSGTGVNGDFYIDTSVYNLYGPKASGTWPSSVSLIGPTGAGFQIDQTADLTSCADLTTAEGKWPGANGVLYMYVVEADTRTFPTSCQAIYNSLNVDVQNSDLSGHFIAFNGTNWHDFGPIAGVPGPTGPQGPPGPMPTGDITASSLALTNTSNQIALGAGTVTTIHAPTPAASVTYTLPDVGASANVVLSEGSQTVNGNKTLSGVTVLSGLSTSSMLTLNGSKQIVSTQLTDGQIMIGKTSDNPTAATITGTPNQVNVAVGGGSITLSTPQNIATSSMPMFAAVKLAESSKYTQLASLTSGGVSADSVLTFDTQNGNRTFQLGGDLKIVGGNVTMNATAGAITMTSSGATSLTLPTSGTLATTTGSFSSPTLTTPSLTDGSYKLTLQAVSSPALTLDRALTINVGDANKSLNLNGNITVGGAFTTSGSFPLILTQTASTNVTLPTTGTLATLAGTETLSNKTLQLTDGSFQLILAPSSSLTANRTLTVNVNNANQTLNMGGNITTVGAISTAGALTTAGAFTTSGAFPLTLTQTAPTNVTLPTTGTIATLAGTETLSNKTLQLTDGSFQLILAPSSSLTADRTLTVNVNNASQTLNMGGSITTANSFTTSGAFPLTLTQTASTNVTLPTTGTLATLAGVETLSNKTLQLTDGSFQLILAPSSSLTANRTLTVNVNNANQTLNMGGNITTVGAISTAGALTTAGAFTTSGAFPLTLTQTASTNVTLPTTGTLATLAGAETLSNKTLQLMDGSFQLILAPSSSLTANRILTVNVNNANQTLNMGGSITTANSFTTSGAFPLTLTQTASTNVTLPTTGTLATLAGTETLSNKTLQLTDGSFQLILAPSSSLTANRTLTVNVNNGNQTLNMGGNITTVGAISTAGALTTADAFTTSGAFPLTLTQTAPTNVTLPASGTLATLAGTETLSNKTLQLTDGSFQLILSPSSGLSANRTLTVNVNNANQTLNMGGSITTANSFTTSGAFPLTLTQTASTNVTLPTTGTLATLAGAETLSNKTLQLTDGSFQLILAPSSSLTANRTLTVNVNNASQTLNMGGSITTANSFTTSGAFPLTLTQTASTNVTLPTTGTLATLAGVETLSNKTMPSVSISNTTNQIALGTGTVTTLSAVAPASNQTITIPDPINAGAKVAYWGENALGPNWTLCRGTAPTIYLKAVGTGTTGGGHASMIWDADAKSNTQVVHRIAGVDYWTLQCVSSTFQYRWFDLKNNVEHLTVTNGATTAVGVGQTAPKYTLDVGGTFRASGGTFTDTTTAASGTATVNAASRVSQSTIAATNASVTTTNASGLFLGGAPIKGTNQTFTNIYGVYLDTGSATSATVTESANLYIAGVPNVTSATNSYAMKIASGVSAFADTTASTTTTTGCATFAGGIGVAGQVTVGTNVVFPSGGGSSLSFYKSESTTLTFGSGLNSPFTNQPTGITVLCTRVGNQVTITVDGTSGTTAGTSNTASAASTTGVPSSYRPASTVYGIYNAIAAGVGVSAVVSINSSGVITPQPDASISGTPSWGTSGQTAGWRRFTISFSL